MCHGELEIGNANVYPTLVDVFVAGASVAHLFFCPPGNADPIKILQFDTERAAYRCLACGLLMIEGQGNP